MKRRNWACEAFAGIQVVEQLREVWRAPDEPSIKCEKLNNANAKCKNQQVNCTLSWILLVFDRKYWLEHTGSPQSSISQAVFKNEKKIDKYSFPAVFDIARTV